MTHVKVSELRANLQKYLDQVQVGQELDVTVRGKVIVRLVPAIDPRAEAKQWLIEARKNAKLGDLETPLPMEWKAKSGDHS